MDQLSVYRLGDECQFWYRVSVRPCEITFVRNEVLRFLEELARLVIEGDGDMECDRVGEEEYVVCLRSIKRGD